jgi:hypothetical protein
VARADDTADAAEQAANPLEHPFALDRVGLDDCPLLGSERARLVDDLARDADLADVAEQRDELGVAALVLAEAEALGNGQRERDDVAARRSQVERKDEEHRHEHELGRDRGPREDLELDPRDERVRDDVEREHERPRVPFCVDQQTERRRGGEERAADDQKRKPLRAAERAGAFVAVFTDLLVTAHVECERGRIAL